MTTAPILPVATSDPVNARILAVSEDRIRGFQDDPLACIAREAGLPPDIVIERIAAMLRAGTVRRVRQTLLSTSLAHGCLVAWVVPEDKLNAAFDWMFQSDPFSGHVVIRSTDAAIAASRYRLWTTLKVPQGYSLEKHCRFLCEKTGAERFLLLPARKLFVLGVGHVRRRGMEPGSKSDQLADATDTEIVKLTDLEWRVLTALKREFDPDELRPATGEEGAECGHRQDACATKSGEPEELRLSLWTGRAAEAGVPLDEFLRVAHGLDKKGVIGRFSTFLEHVKPLATGERVTKFNGLFHWAVPKGREMDAGRQVGRFHIMTHAYWREAGPEFGNVNVMGVAHGQDRDLLLAHKRAIDEHLAACGIEVSYTNVFWGGRSEIKPSEIIPSAYEQFCRKHNLDPQAMRAE
ncbi:MAG: Lrp/AsnC family transcriptional regulator [Tepidisphaerales bacterium]